MFAWKESEYLSFIPDVEKLPAKEFGIVFRFLRTQKRLEELESSMERIESALKKLTLEWDDTYEKFRHLHFRVTKRVKQLEQSDEMAAAHDAGENGAELTASSPSSLSPRQQELQAKILRGRGKITQ